jgi:hypothetical protein
MDHQTPYEQYDAHWVYQAAYLLNPREGSPKTQHEHVLAHTHAFSVLLSKGDEVPKAFDPNRKTASVHKLFFPQKHY